MGRKLSVGEKGKKSIDNKKIEMDSLTLQRKRAIDEGKKFESDKAILTNMFEEISDNEGLDTETKINLLNRVKQSLFELRDAYNSQVTEKIGEVNEEIKELQEEVANTINQQKLAEQKLNKAKFTSGNKELQEKAKQDSLKEVQKDRIAYQELNNKIDNENLETNRQIQSMNANMSGGL